MYGCLFFLCVQALIFPEGTTTNGRAVISFRQGWSHRQTGDSAQPGGPTGIAD